MIYAGIDIGSITAKAALIKNNRLLGTHVIMTGYDPINAGIKVFDALLKQSRISKTQISAIISTGYGRASVSFADKALTEIICHGTGAHFMNPEIRGIIDVGGQDSKAIFLDQNGQVENFAMNDKCAAGTGRFLEVMAKALEVDLELLGDFSLAADKPSKISSICTVFAESEVISMIAKQERRENIIAGIHESAAARVAILANKIKIKKPVMMTGGVAKNKGMVNSLENRLGFKLIVGDLAQENGAIGAAVLASKL
ncbi:MAG: 2-hydroxyglutaryl-CoA dehydratase [Desulfobacula sp.]|jgi:(R)-2-hydroxyacyl-CoA dehydratese activating ATPase|uniref:acyl-CoA dehydratase activase n=3 Tax=Desulfobacula sp. TaxID=2593537 RepID=UPI001D5C44F4|nr:2-hydroxyglutaryl-CoA dehydratase [Desulfobacula sp.]MBT3484782.1 2-hydroxyglutaryl-CoA dehydratase [Desulfobacula sp.]MBT4198605.1 2-hydroxyglutaryl-CoA dehydratase [Desulfobacula sp.]MBT4505548.1 2-hydroxyglutaryl-CoA dehydratase [Desulfobacula sp.]MBT4874938.1 2-hydroxyglutaryl-CoA dehydratase [Desulfobacula sp.]